MGQLSNVQCGAWQDQSDRADKPMQHSTLQHDNPPEHFAGIWGENRAERLLLHEVRLNRYTSFRPVAPRARRHCCKRRAWCRHVELGIHQWRGFKSPAAGQHIGFREDQLADPLLVLT